jgi:hypothetical protein
MSMQAGSGLQIPALAGQFRVPARREVPSGGPAPAPLFDRHRLGLADGRNLWRSGFPFRFDEIFKQLGERSSPACRHRLGDCADVGGDCQIQFLFHDAKERFQKNDAYRLGFSPAMMNLSFRSNKPGVGGCLFRILHALRTHLCGNGVGCACFPVFMRRATRPFPFSKEIPVGFLPRVFGKELLEIELAGAGIRIAEGETVYKTSPRSAAQILETLQKFHPSDRDVIADIIDSCLKLKPVFYNFDAREK